ncbi:glycosyltransferase family 2 protein [Thalassotalea aquiviva]|uniref:glycosyltransferase family 2 protein n=1 Tax=Thalassotalea aquiviva TaxID=3242415 RepID=UPI00352AEEC3
MSGLVSIIIPIYKGKRFITKTVNSILEQDYKNFELLLINDGCPDDSGTIIEQISAMDKRIKCFHKSNGGVADARLFGIKRAKGDIIAFCDQDDLWTKDKLSRQMPLFEDPNVGLVHCGAIKDDINLGVAFRPKLHPELQGQIFDQLVQKNRIVSCTVVTRKSLLQQCNAFDRDKSIMGVDDWLAWLKISLACKVGYVQDYLAVRTIHGDNYSLIEEKMHQAEITCIDKIQTLSANYHHKVNYPKLKNQIHKRYASSYINNGNFRLGAMSFWQAHECYSDTYALFKAIIYRTTPVPLLTQLQSIYRRVC